MAGCCCCDTNEFLEFWIFSAGLPAGGKSLIIFRRPGEIINYFPPASPAGGKSLRSGGAAPRIPRSTGLLPNRPRLQIIINPNLINKLRLSGRGSRARRTCPFRRPPGRRDIINEIINDFSAGLPGRRELIKNSGRCRNSKI